MLNEASGELHFYNVQKVFYDKLDYLWPKISNKKSIILATFIICLFGTSLNGSWMLILLSLRKQFGPETINLIAFDYEIFKNLFYCICTSTLSGLALYFPMCGFIHWFFYVRKRDCPRLWKCQPKKFLSWKDEKHEIILGSTMITLAGVFSGFMNYYISSGGYCTIYYNFTEYGWTYYVISAPLLFLYNDLTLYYAHRIMHFPIVYRNIHKMHHRYKQPTPFSTTAMHPVEMLTYQSITYVPIFIVPIHWSLVVGNAIYMFYYGIIDHSGVEMDAIWPWQPATTFHDNHHQYFHVNFGFNTSIWDKLHGTLRVKDKIYTEKIFYGYGKSRDEATEAEIKECFD